MNDFGVLATFFPRDALSGSTRLVFAFLSTQVAVFF